MTNNTDRDLTELQRLSAAQLRHRYAETFGESVRTGNKPWLIKRIAWRLQALAEGDLSERARRRAAELANDADLRLSSPGAASRDASSSVAGCQPGTPKEVARPRHDDRLPPPGSLLTRFYKGQTHEVKVLDRGFEYQDEVFLSLTAVAKKITGTHCNGFWFFQFGHHSGRVSWCS